MKKSHFLGEKGWYWETPPLLWQNPNQITMFFWSKKVWDWQTPPPQLGQNPKYFQKSHLEAFPYSLNNLSNWSDEKWQKCLPQKEIWFAAQTNPIQHFPKFDGSQLWCRNGFSHWNEIWKAVERNPIDGFPKFEEHSEAPPSFEVVSWHFVKEKTPGSSSKSEFRCMGELINQETPLSSTFHWVEACWKFRIRVGGVAAAVSLFGDDLNCICFDHPNRETAMLSKPP